MKLTLIVLISLFVSYAAWATVSCRNDAGTCVNAPGTTAGQGCQIPGTGTTTHTACFVRGPDGICKLVYNSSGNAVFIPTATTTEWNTVTGAVGPITVQAGSWCSP